MTYLIEPVVQVAFGFGPYDADPLALDWVDITDSVLEVAVTRGRESEFDDFPASTATIVLRNDEREWDPLNSAGTYYGQLLPNVPIRILGDFGGTDIPVWRGYVDGWPAEYTEGGFRSDVTVTATDAFKFLAERPVPDTYAEFLSVLGEPTAWYRLNDRVGDLLPSSGEAGRAGVVKSAITAADPITPASYGAIQIPEQKPALDVREWAFEIPIVSEDFGDNLTAGGTWTVAMLVRMAKRGYRSLLTTQLAGGLNAIGIYVSAGTGQVGAFVDLGNPPLLLVGGGGIGNGSTGPDFGDGLVHHVALVRNSTALTLYVDGQLVDITIDPSATGAYDGTGGRHLIGGTSFGDGTSIYPQTLLGEIMFWDTALDEADVSDLWDYLQVGYSEPRTSGEAIEALLDLIGWSSTLRAIDQGETLVELPVNPGGLPVLQLLQTIARTEGGRLFVDAAGRITFHDRGRATRETVETTVQYTFTDQDRDVRYPTDVGILDGTLRVVLDDRRQYEAAEVTRAGGVTQRVGSSTPSRTYSATDLLFLSDAGARSLADWIVFRYGSPQIRSDAWVIDPQIVPAHWEQLLELEIGHRVKLDLTPGGIGSSINLEQHLELIEHEITPERWTIKLNGSPVDPADYFLWAASATADDDHGWADTDNDPPGGAWG